MKQAAVDAEQAALTILQTEPELMLTLNTFLRNEGLLTVGTYIHKCKDLCIKHVLL